MTLKAYTVSTIDSWESTLLSAAGELRKIRQQMQEKGLGEVDMEATRAIDCINYLGDWAISAESRVRIRIRAIEAAKLGAKAQEEHAAKKKKG